jgi:hypothetical protein
MFLPAALQVRQLNGMMMLMRRANHLKQALPVEGMKLKLSYSCLQPVPLAVRAHPLCQQH